MKIEETKQLIPRVESMLEAMREFVAVRPLEWKYRTENKWSPVERPEWKVHEMDYRKKPIPRIRPFTPIEAAQYLGWEILFSGQWREIISIRSDVITTSSVHFPYEWTDKLIRKDANSEPIPFGVVVEGEE